MRINVSMLPFDHLDNPEEFLQPEAIVEVASAVERAGFWGANVTDHPCPTGRWLDAGGHFAQDPFVILSMVGAHTTKLRLQTGILVLTYRNPFITARAVSTLDVFTKGRVVLGVGAGYLKGEYKALGADFEARNDRMDEYLKAMKAAWMNDEFTFEGTGYQALGNRILPRPYQKPHPLLLIGGNSNRAIRRAVDLGDMWNPFFTAPGLSKTSRTVEMTTIEDLAKGIAYMREYSEKVGREKPPQIFLGGITAPGEKATMSELIDKIGRYKEMGVVGVGINILGKTRREWLDSCQQYGEELVAKVPKAS